MNLSRTVLFQGQSLTLEAGRRLAIGLHQSGNWIEAESIYLELLEINPLDAEIYLLLGMLSAQRLKFAQSLKFFTLALMADPSDAAIQFNLGLLFEKQRYFNLAIKAFDRALTINHHVPMYWFNSALTHFQSGELELTQTQLKEVLRLEPTHTPAWNQLAVVLMSLKRWEESKCCLENAIALDPGSEASLLNLAQVLQALGSVHKASLSYELSLMVAPLNPRSHYNFSLLKASLGRKDSVVLGLERAVVCDPAFASAWFNLGFIAKEQGELLKAEACVQKSILTRPSHAHSHNNLGVILKGQGRFDQAIKCFDRAMVLDPSEVQGLLNRANASQDLKQIEKSLMLYDAVLLIDPQHVDAHLSRAFALLQNGYFEEGWLSYEWRWLDPKLSTPILITKNPQLEMHEFAKRLLIWPEQGVGTEVMFAKFLNQVSSLAAKVMVKLDPRLMSLMQRTHPDLHFISSEVQVLDQDFDRHLPLGSLGRWLGRDIQEIASFANHHLKVDETRKVDIIHRFKKSGVRWIGVNWKSNSGTTGKDRSIALETLMQALNIPHVEFIDLQYSDSTKERQELKRTLNLELKKIPELDTFNDLDGLASLISCCDWVVSVDNSTAHLAGAIGAPTLILLPLNADWRWLKPDTKTPWYQNTRLFWQKRMGVWDDALLDLAEYLKTTSN